jgi:hypothetical protein
VISDLATAAGQASGVYLVAYVEGQSDSAAAYEVLVVFGNAQRTVPDAWRFDAAGCQTGVRVRFDFLAPANLEATCPSFENAGLDTPLQPVTTTVVEFHQNFGDPQYPDPYPGTLLETGLAESSYPRGNAPDPKRRYFLMGLEFDHSLSSVEPSPADRSTCGGIEEPMCFNLLRGAYLTPAYDIEYPFVVGANSWLSTNGFGSSCANAQWTPARPVTWGRLKSQYRN